MTGPSELSERDLALLRGARRAVLATAAADGRARLVPITFAVSQTSEGSLVVYSPLDDKPKSVADPRDLARVRDIRERSRVSVLVDEWSENWTELAWLRLYGRATLLEPNVDEAPDHARAVSLLRERYPQYANHALEQRPMIRIDVEATRGWQARP